MGKFKALAGWAKAFMILAILSLFLAFTLIGAVSQTFPSLTEWSEKAITWVATTTMGWRGLALPEAHQWLYDNVKVISSLIGVAFLALALIFYSAALRRAGRVYSHRPNVGSSPAATVVIGSTEESAKLVRKQAKEAKREENMRKIAEIKADREAKKAAKKAAKEAADSAKVTVDKTADAAQTAAIEEVAKTVQSGKAAASKKIDDIIDSMK